MVDNINVVKRNGRGKEPLNIEKIHEMVEYACEDVSGVSSSQVEMQSGLQFYDGITTNDIQQILIKSASDLIVQSYSKTYKLKVGIIRSGNIFGPGDFNLDRLVPGVIVNSIKNKKTYLRSNGKLSRDYVYVDDVAKAYVLLLEKMKKDNKKLFIYNIGSKTNLTVLGMINQILSVLNKKELKPIILNNSRIEIKEQKLNYLKARKELKWNCKNNFKTDLKKTVNWYKKNLSFFK